MVSTLSSNSSGAEGDAPRARARVGGSSLRVSTGAASFAGRGAGVGALDACDGGRTVGAPRRRVAPRSAALAAAGIASGVASPADDEGCVSVGAAPAAGRGGLRVAAAWEAWTSELYVRIDPSSFCQGDCCRPFSLSMSIVCVTSAAHRRCASRFWMRSAKIERHVGRDLVARDEEAAAHEQRLQRARELARGAIALVLVLRERLHHDLLEVDRVAAHDGAGPRDVALLDLRERVEIVFHAEEALAGGQLPEHDAEREDVGATVDRLAAHLLRRHVRELALERAGARVGHARAELRDAEVDDLGGRRRT